MLIEARICSGKYKVKTYISSLSQKIRLGRKKRIPHLTLYGEFFPDSNGISEIKREIAEIGEDFDFLRFEINGFDYKEGEKGYAFGLKVIPSSEMLMFRDELVEKISQIKESTKEWDTVAQEAWFHITIVNHVSESRIASIEEKISEELNSQEEFKLKELILPLYIFRITLLSNQRRIIGEYDLLQKKWLSRSEALGHYEYNRDLALLRKLIGAELTSEQYLPKENIFLISDLHLGHENIIKYCARPFANVREMDKVLAQNWNFTVKPEDTIYIVGDLSKHPDKWLSQLNGKKIFLQGNHDPKHASIKQSAILNYKGRDFLLQHYPGKPIDWKGWMIHGHTHNNSIGDNPFIDGERKTINVSAELINYKPFLIDNLLALDLDKIKRMNTIDSEIEYF